MPFQITGYRIFIASPGGLLEERKAFRNAITDASEDALLRGAHFVPVGWEDTFGGIGRPQEIINRDLRLCDYLILLLWDRWGSATARAEGQYSSGTEEEFRVALDCYNDPNHPLKEIVVFFKAVAASKLSDPGPQLQKVLDFKRELEASRDILFHTVDEVSVFQSQVHRYVAKWLREHDRRDRLDVTSSHSVYSVDRVPGPLAPAAPEPAASDDLKDALDEADRLADQGGFTDAEAIYARCITKYRSPHAFNRYGVFLLRNNRLAQAEIMFEEVEHLAADNGEKWRSIASINLGLVARIRLDLPKAEQYYQRALDIDQRLGRAKGVSTSLASLGAVAQIRGDLARSKRYYQEALEVAERSAWLKGIASQHCNLGMLSLKAGEFAEAETKLLKALDCEQRLGRIEGVADAYSGLGLVFQSTGDLVRSEDMHTKAMRINEQLGRLTAVGDQHADLGIVYLKMGQLDRAEETLRKALESAERGGRLASIANVQNYLGLTLKEKGNLSEAARNHAEALHIYDQLGLIDFKADQYSHLGSLHEEKGQIPEAVSNWIMAAQLYTDVQQLGKAELVTSWVKALTQPSPMPKE